MSNFHFLASSLSEAARVSLLNKFYFYAGKVSQLYSGQVTYCSDGEVLVNFASNSLESEQAFFAICAGQLFLQLVNDIGDVDGQTTGAKFQLAVHGGQAVGGLYSPITQQKTNLTGKTLDLCRAMCNHCPDNSLLISERCFEQAGAETRVEGKEFTMLDDDELLITFISSEPMSEFQSLLERQAIQLVSIYSD
jgi:class 3 adenylate cyclase